jgi:hypothetical protein
MMGGRAFILLKAGPGGPKSAKQAEVRLAYLLQILRISWFGAKAPRRDRRRMATAPAAIPLDMDNLPESLALLSRSQFCHVNERSVLQ